MWKPVSRPSAASRLASSVSSDRVRAAWRPNEAASCGSCSFRHRFRKRTFSTDVADVHPVEASLHQRRHPVAVGDLVAQASAQPGLLDRVGDDVQAAVDDIGAGMMVDQRRAAVTDRIHQADQRTVADVVPQQRPVELPPQLLQNFYEIGGRRAGDRHPARERAVEMRMPTDGGGKHDFPACVQVLRVRVARGEVGCGADIGDSVAPNKDGAVRDQFVAGAKCVNLAVGDQERIRHGITSW